MLNILFVSDYVCPFCFVAKEALRQALREEGIDAQFTWQPFELTEEPRPRVDTWSDPVRRAHYQVLEQPCQELGLAMKLPPHIVPRPYTRLAFEGWLYACAHGQGDAYNDTIYRAYFMEEQDIGDPAVLTALAGRLGLDTADFSAALREGRYTAAEKTAVAYSRDALHTQSVPGIYLDGAKAEPAGYTVADMRQMLREHLRQTSASAPAAFGCSENGCGFAEAQ